MLVSKTICGLLNVLSTIILGRILYNFNNIDAFFHEVEHGISEPHTFSGPDQRAAGFNPPDAPHDYTFDELKPAADGNGSNRQPYFRFVLLFMKNPDITEEWFHQHWKSVHADLTVTAKNFGAEILRYIQVY